MSITKNKNRNIQVTIGCLRWWLMGGHQGLCKGFRWPPRRWVNTSSGWDGWLQGTNRRLEEAGHGQEETWQWQTHYSDNIQALKAACQEGYGKMAAATSAVADAVGAISRAGSGEGSGALMALKGFVLVRRRLCWWGADSVQIRRLCWEAEAWARGPKLFSRAFLLVREREISIKKSN